MNNSKELQRNIELQQKDLKDLVSHLHSIDRILTAANIATVMVYFAFLMSLYIVSIWGLGLMEDFSNSVFALSFFTVLAALLSVVLAAVKHIGYKHASWFKVHWLAIALFIGFGVLADWFTTSDTQDTKARIISENSAEHKSILGDKVQSNQMIVPPLHKEVAAAKMKYNQCVERLRAGKEPHCRGSYATYTSLKESQALALDAFTSTSTEQRTIDNERLDKLKHDAHNPLIIALSSAANIEIAKAISMLMLIIAIVFEALHFTLSFFRRNTVQAISGHKQTLAKKEGEYLKTSEQERRERMVKTEAAAPATDDNAAFAERMKQRKAEFSQPINEPNATPAIASVEEEKPAKKEFLGFVPGRPKNPETAQKANTEARLTSTQNATRTPQSNQRRGTNEALYSADLERPELLTEPLTQKGSNPRSNAVGSDLPVKGSDTENNGTKGSSESHTIDSVPTAEELLSNPSNFALLKRYVSNPKFDQAFVAIATAQTKCSQKQAMKNHKVGGDMAYWLMIILEAWEIASAPAANKTRTLLTTLSQADAEAELADVKSEILNKES